MNGGAGFVLEVVAKNVVAVGDLDQEVTFFAGLPRAIVGMGWTQTPVASVAMQNAVASACCRLASTPVPEKLSPTVFFQRDNVPRLSGDVGRTRVATLSLLGSACNLWFVAQFLPADIDSALEWYGTRGAGLLLQFIDQLDRTLARIEENAWSTTTLPGSLTASW